MSVGAEKTWVESELRKKSFRSFPVQSRENIVEVGGDPIRSSRSSVEQDIEVNCISCK